MRISKNQRGGIRIDGTDCFLLIKKQHYVEIGINVYNTDIFHWRGVVNAHKHKIRTLWRVIRFLFE